MAAPTVLQTYPADADTGIPIGITLEVVFDKGIDITTAKDVVLFGRDFDLTSGPDSAMWIDADTGNNPYFLTSPGFQGIVELQAEVVYVDLDIGSSYTTYTEVDAGTITSEVDEATYGTAGCGHKLKLTPANQLAADLLYTWHVLGDPDTVGRGISARTVFDVEPDPGNASTTGELVNYGGYSGSSSDTVVVQITTSGSIGTAKYKWYYNSLGSGSATTGRVTNRRFRKLENGLQVRFTGSGFVSGDIYRFNVEPVERLASNYKVRFTTNDGSYSTAPASPSTPATSSPPGSVFPAAPGSSASADDYLLIEGMSPVNGSYHVDPNLRTIVVTFSESVKSDTITQSSVRVWKYPVSGRFTDQPELVELQKVLTLSGSTLTIEI